MKPLLSWIAFAVVILVCVVLVYYALAIAGVIGPQSN